MSDFNSVIEWIFALVNSVLDLISSHFILRVALFTPIAGGLMVFVYYVLQDVSFGSLGSRSESFKPISFRAFGSVQSAGVFGSAHSFTLGSIIDYADKKHKKELRQKEKEELERKREEELNSFKKQETIFFTPDGKKVRSVSWHRNTLDSDMTDDGSISKSFYEKISKTGSISRDPTYDLDSIKERIMNNTEI